MLTLKFTEAHFTLSLNAHITQRHTVTVLAMDVRDPVMNKTFVFTPRQAFSFQSHYGLRSWDVFHMSLGLS